VCVLDNDEMTDRGIQIQGALAHVVVGTLLGLAESHRQQRLRPVQRLDTRLGIDRHLYLTPGAQVEADHVAYLALELRIPGDLERSLLPRTPSVFLMYLDISNDDQCDIPSAAGGVTLVRVQNHRAYPIRNLPRSAPGDVRFTRPAIPYTMVLIAPDPFIHRRP